jgi:hypothetical protein
MAFSLPAFSGTGIYFAANRSAESHIFRLPVERWPPGQWPTHQLLMRKQHRTGDRLPLMTATLLLVLVVLDQFSRFGLTTPCSYSGKFRCEMTDKTGF